MRRRRRRRGREEGRKGVDENQCIIRSILILEKKTNFPQKEYERQQFHTEFESGSVERKRELWRERRRWRYNGKPEMETEGERGWN